MYGKWKWITPVVWGSFVIVLFTVPVFVVPDTRAAYQEPGAVCAESYVVQADDWLSKLADRYLGDITLYPEIAAATNQQHAEDESYAMIDNPDVIEIGWKLCIPETTISAEMGEDEAAEMAESEAVEEPHGAVHWTYTGETGPELWGDLSAEYALCSTGLEQSPIDISEAAPQEGGITFNYQPTNLNLLNNGHTIQLNYDSGSSIEMNGETYNLLQFHFHVPSEHTENGTPAAMELHMVHQNAAGNLAVIGLLMDVGAENPLLARFWDQIPAEEGESLVSGSVNIADALPGGQAYYAYDGSLTTPPCSEGVSWFVLTDRVEVSQEQVDRFKSIVDNNSRPVQALNDRMIGQMAEAEEEEAHDETPHWGYEGETGPSVWGTLDPSFETCSTGQSQSPIDLTNAAPQDLADIVFNYQSTNLNIVNNGHTIQVNYDEGSYIEVDGNRYDLLQFHYHTPSEHAVDGQLAAMELHLVHRNADGELAVVGVLINEGAENALFDPIWSNLHQEEGPVQTIEMALNVADMLPAEQQTYRYSGSLTTPPCSEGVSWFVMETAIELSADQVALFKEIFEINNRPVQPLNDREIIQDNS